MLGGISYENQAEMFGEVGDHRTRGPPHFSDVTGKIKLKQHLLTEADAGHTEFMDENGEKSQSPGEFACPEGWSWEDQWSADENRAVDEQGHAVPQSHLLSGSTNHSSSHSQPLGGMKYCCFSLIFPVTSENLLRPTSPSSNLEALRNTISAKALDRELEEVWVKLLTQLLEDLESHTLPELEGQANLTSLDLQLKKLRDSAMETIAAAARQMREATTDIEDTVADIEGWVEKLTQLAEEPQNSMPDVIIWMLRGEKRVAFSRVPAHQVLFSTHSEPACGRYCGQPQTIFMQYPMDKNQGLKVPVQIR
ncbi:hypothetical protein CRUP_018197, partial [Coryphaenoides rupestris]